MEEIKMENKIAKIEPNSLVKSKHEYTKHIIPIFVIDHIIPTIRNINISSPKIGLIDFFRMTLDLVLCIASKKMP